MYYFKFEKTVIACIACLGFMASGCSTLPAFGPASDVISDAAKIEDTGPPSITDFRLIEISPETLPSNSIQSASSFGPAFRNQELLLTDQKVTKGDVILIRIWEAADDGLFASGGNRETTFTLSVSNSGSIDVPYAGSIQVVDRSVRRIREILLSRYRGKAIDPEILVEIKDTSSREVSVLGAVKNPSRITIPSYGIGLIDLLAMAGGVLNPSWETTLTLSRNGVAESLKLDRILTNPSNNVVVLPGDSIQIDYEPRKFSVYGAITRPGNITIDTQSSRLSDLLAESGGLVDLQAEASSVFIFRPDAANLDTAYRLNFSRPDAFLLASQFKVAPTDIVYVATADASEFRKFVSILVSPFFGTASSAQSFGK